MNRRVTHAALALAVIALAGLAATTTASASQPSAQGPGGYSFNSATPATPGTTLHRNLIVGDFLFWRISLRPGQRLTVRTTVTVPAAYNPGPSPHYERLGTRIYNPVRQPVLCDEPTQGLELIYRGHATAKSGGPFHNSCSAASKSRPLETAGTHYVQVGIGDATLTRGTTLPLTVEITTGPGVPARTTAPWHPGTPSVPPSQQTLPRPDPSPASNSTSPAADSATPETPNWALAAAALGAGASIGIVIAVRRRRTA
ncbi:hypothetical protein [Streptomyces sp. NPDC127033]|uniref:hypothetical protein n=1 Tax=Streptomyces sp. NPDC127033 TaxID=3347110 RepID=UPI003661945B